MQNGHGKSTIAKLIMGELHPTKGSITRHPLIKIGYFSQHSVEDLSISPNSQSLAGTPITALSYFMDHFEHNGERVEEQDARSFLGGFGLKGKVASDTPLAHLSGGQKVCNSVPFRSVVIIILIPRLAGRFDWPSP